MPKGRRLKVQRGKTPRSRKAGVQKGKGAEIPAGRSSEMVEVQQCKWAKSKKWGSSVTSAEAQKGKAAKVPTGKRAAGRKSRDPKKMKSAHVHDGLSAHVQKREGAGKQQCKRAEGQKCNEVQL